MKHSDESTTPTIEELRARYRAERLIAEQTGSMKGMVEAWDALRLALRSSEVIR